MLIFREKLPQAYYAATAAFLLLDYVGGINIRVAFLDGWPVWRGSYYLACFCCLALIAWRPGLAGMVTTAESLLTLPESVLTASADIVTTEEILNFAIAGFVAWYGWFRGSVTLKRQSLDVHSQNR